MSDYTPPTEQVRETYAEDVKEIPLKIFMGARESEGVLRMRPDGSATLRGAMPMTDFIPTVEQVKVRYRSTFSSDQWRFADAQFDRWLDQIKTGGKS